MSGYRKEIAAVVLIAVMIVLILAGVAIYLFPLKPTQTIYTTSTSPTTTAASNATDFYPSNPVYLQLGYPKITDGEGHPYSPRFANYTVSIGTSVNRFMLGTLVSPVLNYTSALKIAASAANVDPTKYSLMEGYISSGGILNETLYWRPSWSFTFARTYQDFWLWGFGSDSGTVTVDALNGTIIWIGGFMEDDSNLPKPDDHFELKVSMTEALNIVRSSNLTGVPRELTENGTVSMIEPRITFLGPDSKFGYLQNPLDPSLSGEKRLCWLIQLSSLHPGYGYQGMVVVDAENGRIVADYAEQNLPSNYYPFLSGAIDGLSAYNLSVLQLSFPMDGRVVGREGKLPLIVPNVVVVRPGVSGSIELNITSNHRQDVVTNLTMANPLPSSQNLSSDSSPEGVSLQFIRKQILVPSNGWSEATLLITAQNNAPQRTYLLEVDLDYMYPLDNQPSKQSFVFLLTVWDGIQQLPPLPIIGKGSS